MGFKPTTCKDLPPDVEAVIERLQGGAAQPPALRGLFAAHEPVFLTRAPGRLDVMGGIADYSGSLVLQMPIREAAVVALQGDATSDRVRLVSLGAVDRSERFDFHLWDLLQDGTPVDYDRARAFFSRHRPHRWAASAAPSWC